jgi:hypothetical protein
VPSWVKTFAVRRFGTNDKPALIAGTLVFVAIFAAIIGALAMRRKAVGVAGIAAFGLVGAAAANARPNVTRIAMVPSLVGAAAGIATLLVLRSIVVDSRAPPDGGSWSQVSRPPSEQPPPVASDGPFATASPSPPLATTSRCRPRCRRPRPGLPVWTWPSRASRRS